jgi:hypothetical protein
LHIFSHPGDTTGDTKSRYKNYHAVSSTSSFAQSEKRIQSDMSASKIKVSDSEFLNVVTISSIHLTKRETQKVSVNEFPGPVSLITGEESVLTIRPRGGKSLILYGLKADVILSEIQKSEHTPEHVRIQLLS